MRVTVVGAGVIGLTTALALEEAGHDVTVLAAERGARTTSGAAGAVWLPFQVGPKERVRLWARRTRERLSSIARSAPEAGVDEVPMYLATSDEVPPWWAAAVEDLQLVRENIPYACRAAFRLVVPRCDPTLYLPWLERRLQKSVQRKTIEDLA